MDKTITISETNWKKLTLIKVEKGFKTLDEVVGDLL